MLRFTRTLLCLALTSFAIAAPEKWASAIDDFTKADAAHPPPRNGIVFVGSSSIRMWASLARDFPGLPVINRGFGGSELADSAFYADRIVIPYQPRTVVVYAGENDVNAGKTADAVFASFNALRAKVHAALPGTRIVFIGLKPSPSRWKHKETMLRANELIRAACAQDKRLAYVDVWTPMLDAKGEPRPELFLKDMLHMKPEGYVIWTKAVAPHLK